MLRSSACLGRWTPGDIKCKTCEKQSRCRAIQMNGGRDNVKGTRTRRNLSGRGNH